jgi:UPF0176 protein
MTPRRMEKGYKVAALYQFAPLANLADLQSGLLEAMKTLRIKGSILLAEEGINGTIAGKPDALDMALIQISRITGLADFNPKFSDADEMPFRRMKVRLKTEIVTIGKVKANPNEMVGEYVRPEKWNALISDPDVIVIDTRNSYEVDIGTFKNAVDPKTESFSEFPKWVRENLSDKSAKIAMFCTGGIRCEKASSFLKHEGFENVYHLQGGILKYLEEIKPESSLWRGGCFVFDQRVAVGHGLQVTDHTICHGCLRPVTSEDRTSTKYEEGVCCPACADQLSEVQKASNRERQKQVELAAKKGRQHLGPM